MEDKRNMNDFIDLEREHCIERFDIRDMSSSATSHDTCSI